MSLFVFFHFANIYIEENGDDAEETMAESER